MLGQRYFFEDGRTLFMSDRSFREITGGQVLGIEKDREDLEFILAFDQFTGVKTSKNIAEWLRKGHERHQKILLSGYERDMRGLV